MRIDPVNAVTQEEADVAERILREAGVYFKLVPLDHEYKREPVDLTARIPHKNALPVSAN